jgi:hypothetical protein
MTNHLSLSCVLKTTSFQTISELQVPDKVESSMNRLETIGALKTPNNIEDLLKIASNNDNEKYPVFRMPNEYDKAQTVATGEI